MKSFFWAMLPGLLMPLLSHAGETPKQLAARHQCFGCHAVNEFRVGPAFQQVAERYGVRKDAITYLFNEVKAGSVGKWGSTPMPPETVPDPELKNILVWVMQQ
ncbi:MAG: c-type cytochrome [Betaproteobacteria bacterium]